MTYDQQRAAVQAVFDKANAVEIDSDECLDFDECTAMLVPIDVYNELIEAITALREALRNASEVRSTDTGEPVAWIIDDGEKRWATLHPSYTKIYSAVPLYTTPPSVEAAIEATKEKAAKEGWMAASSDCEDRVAAAIRSMK